MKVYKRAENVRALTGADGVPAARRGAVRLDHLQNERVLLVRVGLALVRRVRVRRPDVLLRARAERLRPQRRRRTQAGYAPPLKIKCYIRFYVIMFI